jgi:ATP-dependent Lon protease
LNAKDLIDISQEVLKKIEVIPVKSIDEVLKIALTKDPETYKSKKNKDHKKSIAGQNLEKVDKSIAH